MLDEAIQHLHPVTMPDYLRVHRQYEHRPLIKGDIEFVPPDRVHIIGVTHRYLPGAPVKLEIRPVIENPFHRKLDQSCVVPFRDQPVRPVVRHHAAVINKAQRLDDIDGCRRQVPCR